jgi:hypothetical protein
MKLHKHNLQSGSRFLQKLLVGQRGTALAHKAPSAGPALMVMVIAMIKYPQVRRHT